MENERIDEKETFTLNDLSDAFSELLPVTHAKETAGNVRVFGYQTEVERHFKIVGVRRDDDGEFLIELESC
jgi:hypothetical protein